MLVNVVKWLEPGELLKCEIESKIRLIADVADHAAKMSVEEHMQSTTIETLQKDLDSGCM